ncbi:MAG: exopolysaccharide Pel transporter PelG [Planctomycetaceae bacterium]
MAGIGFELRRMIDQRDGFLNRVRAYACAGLISSGPWIMTILTLTLLSAAGPILGGMEGYAMFRALVTYAYAFSLVVVGVGQLSVTRRVADLLYGKAYERVLPGFSASAAAFGLFQAIVGGLFCAAAGFSAALSFLAVALYVIVSVTWLALIWLSVTREFDEVLRAYAYGMLVALGGLFLPGLPRGTTGLLAVYTAGQGLTLALLIRVILRGMESKGRREWHILGSLKAFPTLVGVGLFYNAAIWVDKMAFWFLDGTGPHRLIRYHPLYDTCCFFAYITVVPALAVNLIRLETSFYEVYRAYYSSILGGTPLRVIEEKRERMFENLREGTVRLLRVQGAITALCVIFAPFLMGWLDMPEAAIRIFRLTCFGAFFHVLLLICVLMQLYFDLKAQALATSVFFFFVNGALAFWSAGEGLPTYGIGYCVSSFLSLLLGYTLLHNSLEKLDFLTFTNQPIGGDPDPEPEADAPIDAASPAPAPPQPPTQGHGEFPAYAPTPEADGEFPAQLLQPVSAVPADSAPRSDAPAS